MAVSWAAKARSKGDMEGVWTLLARGLLKTSHWKAGGGKAREPSCCNQLLMVKGVSAVVSVPGPESWSWHAGCATDKLFHFWSLHFLKGSVIKVSVTVLGRLNEAMQVRVRASHALWAPGASCSRYPWAEKGCWVYLASREVVVEC